MDYEKAHADLGNYMRRVSECQKLSVLTKERRVALKSLNIEAIRINRILASLTPDHALIRGSCSPATRPLYLLSNGHRL